MRLSVFRGGATAEAAQHVAGATIDTLGRLIDKALLRRLPNGRYEIHELLRQFAAEQLSGPAGEGERNDAQRQHSDYYLNLLAGQEQRLQSLEQRAALDMIHLDYENINAAWRHAVQQHAFARLGPAVHPLFLYCDVRGTLRAGIILFATAAAELGTAASAGDRHTLQVLWGRLIVRLGACEVLLGNYRRGEQLLLDGLPHIAEDWERAFTLMYLGQAASEVGELALARTRLDDSAAISRQCNHFALMAQAMQVLEIGRPVAEAQRLAAESLALARKAQRPDLIATRLNQLGWHSWCLGDYAHADACWQEGIILCDQLGLRGENAWPLDCLGFAAWCRGNMVSAEHNIEEALAIYTEVGRQAHVGMCMAELALVLASTDRIQEAVGLARQAVAITRHIDGQMMLIVSLDYLGAVLLAAGELEEARETLIEAIRRAWGHQFLFSLMIAFYYFAELLVLESQHAGPEDEQRKHLALALLDCTRREEGTWQAFRDMAAVLQAQIAGALPSPLPAGAQQGFTGRSVGELVSRVLGEQSQGTPMQPAPVLSRGSGNPRRGERSSVPLAEPLSEREIEVLGLLAQGLTNQQIADALTVVLGTVKAHNHHIFGKLGVSNRVQALARARELKLI
jgi:DNA-binding CsgD family transcriptional regulator/tetratricopeptide (TPR) repeat protein